MFSKKNALLLLLSAVLGCSSAQHITSGECPAKVDAMNDFDIEKYAGEWYEFAVNVQESAIKCGIDEFKVNGIDKYKVETSFVNEKDGTKQKLKFDAVVQKPSTLIFNQGKVSINYTILDTDYVNYSIVYYCAPFSENTNSVVVWILTRQPKLKRSLANKALRIIKKYKIAGHEMKFIDQLSC